MASKLLSVGVVPVLLDQVVGAGQDDAEHVVEVVGDAGGELAEHAQPLGAQRLLLQARALGQVAGDPLIEHLVAQRHASAVDLHGQGLAARLRDLELRRGGLAGSQAFQPVRGRRAAGRRDQVDQGPARAVLGASAEQLAGLRVGFDQLPGRVEQENGVAGVVDQSPVFRVCLPNLFRQPRLLDDTHDLVG